MGKLTAWTDYPFAELGDKPNTLAPIRKVEVVDFDGDKYATIKWRNRALTVKSGYLYSSKGRLGEVPGIDWNDLIRDAFRGA
jgi:hypothetical protein